jgi:Flp pilus assembly protein TadG
MKRTFKKIFNKRGAEIAETIIALPALLLVLAILLTIAQMTITKMGLQQAAYNAGRAAVVCENLTDGKHAAETIGKENVMTIGMGIESSDDVNVEITQITGSTWEKGVLIKCVIGAEIHTLLPLDVFTGTNYVTAEIVMMVERPAP